MSRRRRSRPVIVQAIFSEDRRGNPDLQLEVPPDAPKSRHLERVMGAVEDHVHSILKSLDQQFQVGRRS